MPSGSSRNTRECPPNSRLASGRVTDLPPLIVGPSLGTSVADLWSGVARRLAGTYQVIGWDLPGHGASPRPRNAFTIDDLAASVIKVVEDKIGGRPFTYAGVSVAGAVGAPAAARAS